MGLPKPTPPIAPITRSSDPKKPGQNISDPWLIFVQRVLTYIAQKVETGLEADLPSPLDVYPDVIYFATDTQIGRISDGQTWTVFLNPSTMTFDASQIVSGILARARGGTGIDTSGATDGQLLIGNTGDPFSLATLTQGSGVTITNGAGSVTIAATGTGGDVVGPASATDNAIARYDGTTGKLIQNSAPLVQDDGRISTVTDPTSAQDAATKAYVDAQVIAGGGNDISSTAVGSEPGTPTAGDTDLYTNAITLARYSGSAWVPWGPIWALSNPVTNGPTTWVNQGGASIDSTRAALYLLGTAAAGPELRLYVKSTPATPYVVTALLHVLQTSANFSEAGLCWRESGSGKIVTFSITQSAALGAAKWTSPTVFSASYAGNGAYLIQPASLWLRIADDGANRIMSVSLDGYNYSVVHTVGNTDFLTADEIGIVVKEQNATYQPSLTLVSWKET